MALPALVLVHGGGLAADSWELTVEEIRQLAPDLTVLALDMPGFGASPPLANGTAPTPHALATAVGRFLDSLRFERVHVAGNSLGGWVALELAKAGRALSATGLCSAGFWTRPLGPRGGPDVRRIGRALLPVVPARLVRSYVTSPGFEAANAAMRAGVLSDVERIDVPVTLAWGELDRLIRRPRTKPEHWRSVLLRGCGHIPTWDDPAQVARALLMASS